MSGFPLLVMTQHLWQSVGPGGPLEQLQLAPGAEANTTPAAHETSGWHTLSQCTNIDVDTVCLMIVSEMLLVLVQMLHCSCLIGDPMVPEEVARKAPPMMGAQERLLAALTT